MIENKTDAEVPGIAGAISEITKHFERVGQRYALPPTPLIIKDEPAECPTCEGSGEVMASGTDWEVADEDGKVECSHCGGKGHE